MGYSIYTNIGNGKMLFQEADHIVKVSVPMKSIGAKYVWFSILPQYMVFIEIVCEVLKRDLYTLLPIRCPGIHHTRRFCSHNKDRQQFQ